MPEAREGSTVRVDCHLHTAASGDAVTTLEQLADRAARAGIDVVCVTDHNEISAALAAAAAGLGGVRVIVGEEIRTQAGEVIGLFLTERIPYVLPLREAVTRIRQQDGLVYLPHPVRSGAVQPRRARRRALRGAAGRRGRGVQRQDR